MKRGIAFLLICLMLGISAAAAEDHHTLAQLWENTPAEWRETVVTKWRTVEIDTPVFVPQADAMPVLRVRRSDAQPMVGDLLDQGWTMREAGVDIAASFVGVRLGATQSLAQYKEWRLTSEHAYAITDLSQEIPEWEHRTLAGILGEMGSRATTMSGGLTWQLDRIEDLMINVRTNPKTGERVHVYLHASARQTYNGIPILQHIAFYLRNQDVRHMRAPELMVGTGLDGSESIAWIPADCEPLDEDVPLCDFSVIQQALRNEVDAGHIRRILDISLGLLMLNDPSATDVRMQAIAVPVWRVECWYLNSPTAEMKPDDPEYPTNSRGKLAYTNLFFNAQTGARYDLDSRSKDAADYAGHLTWGEVE